MTLQFIETRWNDGKKPNIVSFSNAILSPSASFGWLYIPEILPELWQDFLKKHLQSSYQELALDLLTTLDIDISQKDLKDVLSLYSWFDDTKNPAPVIKIAPDAFVCELYHGPTRAFKDMALQPFWWLLSKLAVHRNKNYLIMVATSGDTWPATLESLRDKPNIKVVCLYPDGGTSDVQRLQMVTTHSDNLKILWVKGNFDDTQNALKSLLKSKSFKEKLQKKNLDLSAANSVNFGRIIFQIVYHIHSYLEMVRSWEITLWEEILSLVPSWNFWDALWWYYAKQLCLPIKKFLIASNENNVLTNLIQDWKYDLRKVEFKNTTAPAMDILISSNIERILFHKFWAERTKELMDNLSNKWFYTLSPAELAIIQKDFEADFMTDSEVKSAIKKYADNGYLMDPHTATCMKLYEKDINPNIKKLIFSTAQWTKFAPTIVQSLEENSQDISDQDALRYVSKKLQTPIPKQISDLFSKEITQKDIVEKADIEKYILNFLEK